MNDAVPTQSPGPSPQVRAALVRVVLGDVAAGRPQLSGPALAATRILTQEPAEPAQRPAGQGTSSTAGAAARRVLVPVRAAVPAAVLAVAGAAVVGVALQRASGPDPVAAPAPQPLGTVATATTRPGSGTQSPAAAPSTSVPSSRSDVAVAAPVASSRPRAARTTAPAVVTGTGPSARPRRSAPRSTTSSTTSPPTSPATSPATSGPVTPSATSVPTSLRTSFRTSLVTSSPASPSTVGTPTPPG